MMDEHVFDLLPEYALGSLSEPDELKVARHLPGCPLCRGELASYWATLDQVALATPLRTPPADLRSRVLQRVEAASATRSTVADATGSTVAGATASSVAGATGSNVAGAGGVERASREAEPPVAQPKPVPHQPAAGQPAARQPGFFSAWFNNPFKLALGTSALLLLILFGLSSLLLWQRVNQLQAQLSDARMQMVHLNGTQDAPQAAGYLMVFKNEAYGSLAVDNAPVLDANHQYQIWLVKDGKRVSGGVFSVNQEGYGTLEIAANQPLDQYQSFGITVEPMGGSPGPTGKRVLSGKME